MGEDLAKAALIFLGNPTRAMIKAAQKVCPDLAADQVRGMLKAIAAGIAESRARGRAPAGPGSR